METIILHETGPSSRLLYTVQHLITQLLGLSVLCTTDKATYLNSSGIRINYTGKAVGPQEVMLFPYGLLSETGVRELPLDSTMVDDVPVLFPVRPGYHLPFDPLSAAFFMLSRYEEYLPFIPDQHGRYRATQSWAYRAGALQQPVVYQWAALLAKAIQQVYPNWTPQSPGYRFVPTYDIDMAWLYLHRGLRGLVRTGLDVLRGATPQLGERWRVLTGRQPDPYEAALHQLSELHQRTGIPARVFWLLAKPTRQDPNAQPNSSSMQAAIEHTQRWAELGIHPSYYSSEQPALIAQEQTRLAEVTGQPIEHSRQHFLRFRLPATYRALLANGIRHDYSMGYAAAPGYRAGTSEPFPWYDLERETITKLSVHPFVVMDVTLKNYQQLDASAAAQQLSEMQEYCRKASLQFCTLWHNSSFAKNYGWNGWWEVYQGLFR